MRLFNDLLFVFLAFLHAVPEVFLQLLLDTLSDLLLSQFFRFLSRSVLGSPGRRLLQLPNKVATFLLPFYALKIGHFESCLSICWNHFRNFICLVPETWASRREEKLYSISAPLYYFQAIILFRQLVLLLRPVGIHLNPFHGQVKFGLLTGLNTRLVQPSLCFSFAVITCFSFSPPVAKWLFALQCQINQNEPTNNDERAATTKRQRNPTIV